MKKWKEILLGSGCQHPKATDSAIETNVAAAVDVFADGS